MSRFRPPLFSPRGFLIRALLLALAFGLVHAVGLRRFCSILSGTSPTGNVADWPAALLGCVYVFFYFAFVLAVPILLIGAALLAIGRRAGCQNPGPSRAERGTPAARSEEGAHPSVRDR